MSQPLSKERLQELVAALDAACERARDLRAKAEHLLIERRRRDRLDLTGGLKERRRPKRK
jgi:hypothetical protein